MKLSKVDMDKKLEITVKKTTDAIARIERFVTKYGSKLNNEQLEWISNKLNILQEKIIILQKNER